MTRLILLLLGVAHLVTVRAFISRSAAQDGQDDRTPCGNLLHYVISQYDVRRTRDFTSYTNDVLIFISFNSDRTV